jgi:hypothetical protein
MTRYASQRGEELTLCSVPALAINGGGWPRTRPDCITPSKNPITRLGWAPGTVWTGLEDKIIPRQDSNPEPPSRYQFSIPTTLLRSLLLQTCNRKNPSHFDPATKWASHSATHVKFVFLDKYVGLNYYPKTSPQRAETSTSTTQLQAHLQVAPVQQLPEKYTSLEKFHCQVADNVPNYINPNVGALANLISLFANSIPITTCSKLTAVDARNTNTIKHALSVHRM